MSQASALEPVFDVHGHAWAVTQRPTMHVPRWLLALGIAVVVALAGVTGWAIGRAGTDAGKAATGVQSVPLNPPVMSPLQPVGQTSHVTPGLKGTATGPGVRPAHAVPNLNETSCLITLRWSSGFRNARVPC